MKNKNAQIWSLDIMVAMALFLAGIIIFFIYTLNQSGEAQENFELLSYDGRVITDSLMSSGHPQGWNSGDVITLGITDGNKINETKLETLYNMIYTDGNYTYTKNLLNTIYDYYIFLEENMTINSNQVEGIGKPGATKNNINARNLIKTTRFTIYQNKTTPLYLYVWEE